MYTRNSHSLFTGHFACSPTYRIIFIEPVQFICENISTLSGVRIVFKIPRS